MLIAKSRQQLKEYLTRLNYGAEGVEEIALLEAYKWLVSKEKAILTAINMMKARQNNYIGFLWSPSYSLPLSMRLLFKI